MESYFNVTKNVLGRFFFLFGQTKDRFCDDLLVDMDLDYALHKHLKQLGYQRIIFYSKPQKLYFYDDESLRLTKDLKAKPEAPAPKKSKIQLSSPLKNKLRTSSAPAQKVQTPVESETEPLHLGKLDETQAFLRINNCMQDSNAKTAVIFTNADDFISFFGREIRNEIFDSFNRYDGLAPDNYNIMLFIFPQGSFSEVSTRYEDTFFGQKFKTSPVINISPPGAGEVRNVINHYRLVDGLEIDFSQLDSICKRISQEFYAESYTLKGLIAELGKLAQAGKNLNNEQCDIMLGKKDKVSAMDKLEELIGMDSVKDEIKRLKSRASKKTVSASFPEFKSRLLPPVPSGRNDEKNNLHYCITGNPGTGKTTAAKLLGEVYYELGYLPSGHTVKVTRADLVAGYVGQTAINTKSQIEKAMGGVLFIDEAYMLCQSGNENDFGQEAIDTILEAMSDRNGEFAVVVAGYPDNMKAFIASNPGLERRFKKVIHIEDYKAEELHKIFDMNIRQKNYVLSPELEAVIGAFFENWFRAREKNWGNAGNVEKFIEQLYDNWCYRPGVETEEGLPILDVADVPPELQQHCKSISEAKKDAFEKLNSLIGLGRVKGRIEELRRRIEISNTSDPGHYIFAGNPGTGKTTVARLMGDIFCDIGVLRRGHVVEVTRENLVAGFVGQTADKTAKKLEEALDGILFIDEAYTLVQDGPQSFGQEAVNKILDFMENNRDRICVICAGYTNDMEKFVASNSGLKSRFTEIMQFDDYTTDELLRILPVVGSGFAFSPEYLENSKKIFDNWTENKSRDFGNGRDVRKYLEECRDALYDRLYRQYGKRENIPNEEINKFIGYDIPEKYQDILFAHRQNLLETAIKTFTEKDITQAL